jgi:hypothetical protein
MLAQGRYKLHVRGSCCAIRRRASNVACISFHCISVLGLHANLLLFHCLNMSQKRYKREMSVETVERGPPATTTK